MDGFGRRAVSFAPVKDLGVQFVKVDGGITRKLLTSDVARGKMNAIVGVSQALRFNVIAECMQESDVLRELKELGVGYAQGFGVSQPQPMDHLARAA